MGMKYLGDRFDLHAGGEDLIFPHHECEIAQNEALADHPVITYWAHTRFLQVEGEKMSKSAGNFYTVRDLIAPDPDDDHVPASIREMGGIDPLALRYALMQGQYRKPFNFKLDTLRTAAQHVQQFQHLDERVASALDADRDGPDRIGDALEDAYQRSLDAMCDDLNTPAALAAALDGAKALRSVEALSGAEAQAADDWLAKINDLLGILRPDHAAEKRTAASPESADNLAATVEDLLEERATARSDGDYDRADAIRDTLEAMGIEVMDRPDGTEWRRKVEL
jgi:cysteinyl-tRNA synthetase